MSKKNKASNIAKNYEEQLYETGKFVCEHCNRTGINPKYREINRIVRALESDDAFICLHCYGKKEIDWAEYSCGYFEEDLKNRKLNLSMLFLYSIYSYILYLINGENHFDKKTKKWLHYDLTNECWHESKRAVGSVKGLNKEFTLMLNALEEGYTNDHRYGDFLMYRQDNFYLNPIEIIKNIKAELINEKEITLKRILEIKEELELIGITIEEFERFQTKENFEKKLSSNFNFTWDSVLEKFNLSKADLSEFRKLSNKCTTLKFILPIDIRFDR